MTKINKSISIDKKIVKLAEQQAKKERRSFSSFIENLVDTYLKQLINKENGTG